MAAWGAWKLDAALLPWAYVDSVAAAGGQPVLLPPLDLGDTMLLDTLQGLIVSGGRDIEATRFGVTPHAANDPPQPRRDQAEFVLIGRALDLGLPLLAICRGMQIMNVTRGGDLVQHLPETIGDDRHLTRPGAFADHEIEISPGSALGALLGPRASVKSHHHQARGRLGDGLVAAAWAADGTIEAIEAPQHPFAVRVLWHPERDAGSPLFRALIEATRARTAVRA